MLLLGFDIRIILVNLSLCRSDLRLIGSQLCLLGSHQCLYRALLCLRGILKGKKLLMLRLKSFLL